MSGTDSGSVAVSEDECEWVIAKSLLDATSRSITAMEHHARYAFYHQSDPDTDEIRSHLEQAKVQHERILEDLDAAIEALDEV